MIAAAVLFVFFWGGPKEIMSYETMHARADCERDAAQIREIDKNHTYFCAGDQDPLVVGQ